MPFARLSVAGLLVLLSLMGCGDKEPAAEAAPKQDAASPGKATATATATAPTDPEARVDWIRTEYDAIQKKVTSGEWKKVEVDDAPFGFQTTEGTSIEVYCESPDQPRKLRIVFFGEMGRSENEVFVADGKPFFGLKININYNRPGGDVVSKDEHRFYYDGANVVRLIGPDKKTVDMPTGKVSETAKDLQSDANKILAKEGICKG